MKPERLSENFGDELKEIFQDIYTISGVDQYNASQKAKDDLREIIEETAKKLNNEEETSIPTGSNDEIIQTLFDNYQTDKVLIAFFDETNKVVEKTLINLNEKGLSSAQKKEILQKVDMLDNSQSEEGDLSDE